jgi:predicted MFS family arabinose efflux permease
MQNEKRNIFLLTLAQVLMVSSVIVMITFSSFVGQLLSPDPRFATVPIAIAVLGAACFAIPMSMLMKRYGRKKIFHFGACLGVISGIMACAAIYYMNFTLFCFAALLHGGYQSIGSFYRFAALEVSQNRFHERAVSYVLAGGLVAAFLGSSIALALNDIILPATYIGAFSAIIILGIIAQIPLSFLKFPSREIDSIQTVNHAKASVLDILKRPIFLCASLNAAGGYLLMSFVMTASPLAIKGCGFGIDNATYAIQWHSFAMFAPAFFTGHLIKRFGPIKIILAGLFFMMLTAAINLYAENLMNFYAGLIFVGIGWNFMFTAGTTWVATTYAPHEKALAQGMNDFIVFSMTALSSFCAGILYADYGWQHLNIIVFAIVAVLVISTLILVTYDRNSKKVGV